MLVALVASVCMGAGDIAQAVYIILLAKGRSVLAGTFDGLQDLTSVVAIGGGASTVFHHRIDDVTVATFAGLLVASIIGADLGNRLSARFVDKPRIAQSAI